MRQPLNKIAIIVGISVDILASFVSILGLFIAMMAATGTGGMPTEEEMAGWLINPGFLIAEFVLSLLPTVLGGFLAGRIAKREHVRHATWVGVVVLIVFGILTFIPMEGATEPLWFDLLTLAATVPAAMAGGRLSIPRGAVTTA